MFEDALEKISERLDRATQDGLLRAYGLIGGFATAVHGVPRSTEDIDFVVIPAANSSSPLADALGAEFRPGGTDDPLRGVFHVSIQTRDVPVPIQLIILPARWNDVIIKGLYPFQVLGVRIPVVSWEALVLLKLYGGAPQDLLDVAAIIQVQHPSPDAWSELSALARSVGISEALTSFQEKWQK